jgi:hypothetical protein
MVNPGAVSPYELMVRYKKEIDPSHEFERLSLDHLSDVVKAGRSNCVLSTKKLESYGIKLRHIDDAITHAFSQLSASR